MSTESTSYLQRADYEHTIQSSPQTAKLPTAAQEARRARLRRFNRLVISIPVGITALGWVALILGLIWLSVAGEWFAMDTNQAHYRQLFSAIADVVTMLMLAPMLLLCALPVVGAVALGVYQRRRRADAAAVPAKLPLFWRIENVVISIHDSVARLMPKLARPVINAHAMAAFVRRFLTEVKQIVSQEKTRNGDDR